MWQTDPQVFGIFSFFFFFFRDNAVEIKCHQVMVSCCHINAVVKLIIYFIIICFMENKYWSNLKMFISKVEDIDPVTALYYDVFTSIIMPNDWWVANWIILSYGNWCSWVIFTQYCFCWIPVCPSLWSIQTTFLVYGMYEKALDFVSICDYFS